MLAKKYRERGFVIACLDEATFGLIPNIVRGWARRGSRPVAIHNFQHKWTNVFGARSKRSFVFSFSKKKNQRVFIEFLKKLVKRWGKLCLFIDGAPYHRGKRVKAFAKGRRKTIKLVYFPKYSPDINPIEQCWKPARKVLGNRLVKSIPAMKYHLCKTFGNRFFLPKMFDYLSY